MKSIMNYIRQLRGQIEDFFSPDTSGLIAELAKIETKIEKAIDKDTRKLHEINRSFAALELLRRRVDADVDTAYKLLHSVSSLTK